MINRVNPDFNCPPNKSRLHNLYAPRTSTNQVPVEVSIITPYWNTDAVFLETVESVRRQSMQNWEWIVVDDGSTETASLKRLREVAAQDHRLTVIRQDNLGPGAARNAGFSHSRGRYICLLDSDDMIEPTYLEKGIWFLESNPEFQFCNSYSVIFDGKQLLWTQGFEHGAHHLRSNSGPPISIIRRNAYERSGGFDPTILFGHEDWDFWLAMARSGQWGYTIQEFLQWYRRRGTGRFEQIMKSGDVHSLFEERMREKYDDLTRTFPNPIRDFSIKDDEAVGHPKVDNLLEPIASGGRVLFLLSSVRSIGELAGMISLLKDLVARDYQITICMESCADPVVDHELTEMTADVFVLMNFLNLSSFSPFLLYLARSRSIDTFVVTKDSIGHQLVPFLKSYFKDGRFVDLGGAASMLTASGGTTTHERPIQNYGFVSRSPAPLADGDDAAPPPLEDAHVRRLQREFHRSYRNSPKDAKIFKAVRKLKQMYRALRASITRS